MNIIHHGGIHGVTGSCHQLTIDGAHPKAVLIDCGLFQGNDRPDGGQDGLKIDFAVEPIQAVVLTHVHIDHVGRLPYLLAAGYTGPIVTSHASAKLLPMVLADALKVGFTRDRDTIDRFLAVVDQQLIGIDTGRWHPVCDQAVVRLQRAGHILGSSYVELHVDETADHTMPVDPEGPGWRVVFSGDLGAADTPLLPEPVSPERADVLVLESTYGDRLHADRASRQARLKDAIEHALTNDGTVLIPAFSIGRTQELLYEIEDLFARLGDTAPWNRLQIILDSPLAADYTEGYQQLRDLWDAEAQARLAAGRHPLAFDQLMTIDSHADHQKMVSFLKETGQGAVVIAASGMCAGGRVVNYLKALLADPRSDVIFVGYQAPGTPGHAILTHGTRAGDDEPPGWVSLDGDRYTIEAAIHEISGYSAHADQAGLVEFVRGIPTRPDEIRLVHGDPSAKAGLKQCLEDQLSAQVLIPGSEA
ncbi:MAG: MBL fold metallo-hydrolase [Wenzhouxiangella sp.]|nr:MBL fold metallo-hydrolase [Wenzhouxiangella sp.]